MFLHVAGKLTTVRLVQCLRDRSLHVDSVFVQAVEKDFWLLRESRQSVTLLLLRFFRFLLHSDFCRTRRARTRVHTVHVENVSVNSVCLDFDAQADGMRICVLHPIAILRRETQ